MDKYNISSKDQYDSIYKDSINDPESFWSEIALRNFSWKSKWENVLEWDFNHARVEWFKGAKLNIIEYKLISVINSVKMYRGVYRAYPLGPRIPVNSRNDGNQNGDLTIK